MISWRRASARRTLLGRLPASPRLHRAHLEGVLGTSLELQFVVAEPEAGRLAEAAALAEIDRLEAIFSTYSPSSEFSCWQTTRGADVAVSPELAEVLEASERWREITGGAFDPAVEALTRLWASAAASGGPQEDELAAVRREMSGPRWLVNTTQGTARRMTGLPATLNAIAKGYIVDRACAAAAATAGVREALVNLGGDLRHAGERPVRVAIADPFAAAENAPPLAVVRLRARGMATSGGYRRGFSIGGRLRSHLLDPRTGQPATGVASATVVAASVALADALSTACSILEPERSLALADSLPGVGCLLVTAEGSRLTNAAWRAIEEGTENLSNRTEGGRT